MKLYPLVLTVLLRFFFIGCSEKDALNTKKIVVTNTMDADRKFETVSIAIDSLEFTTSDQEKEGRIVILNATTRKLILSQTIDSDGDGADDTVLFQPAIKAKSEMVFTALRIDSLWSTADSLSRCYSRFVPERNDDYAWENDRVAFRTYGPVAQKMMEDNMKGGTLSSGIDAWLKRVDYPIINKWYKKDLETDGSYHEDSGEGLDNFHVGTSRGVGGIAVKNNGIYHISKNFVSWKRLYNGPIRTSFVLTYADWDANGKQISEEKNISLDYGSNLSKFEITIKGTDTISAGLTLHEIKGTTGIDESQGWVSYWEPHFDSEIGMGIVVPNGAMVGHEKFETEKKDGSNIFARIKIDKAGKMEYYAGFGWKKSGQFGSQAEWEDYLRQFAKNLKNPLVVEMR